MTIGARLKKVREAMGISLSDVARASGVQRDTLRRIEDGTSPRSDDLLLIGRALGLTDDQTAGLLVKSAPATP